MSNSEFLETSFLDNGKMIEKSILKSSIMCLEYFQTKESLWAVVAVVHGSSNTVCLGNNLSNEEATELRNRVRKEVEEYRLGFAKQLATKGGGCKCPEDEDPTKTTFPCGCVARMLYNLLNRKSNLYIEEYCKEHNPHITPDDAKPSVPITREPLDDKEGN